jgi:hypothetical protein
LCRLKEFTERWEVDKYLSATGYLPGNVKPFFIALPKVLPVMHFRMRVLRHHAVAAASERVA